MSATLNAFGWKSVSISEPTLSTGKSSAPHVNRCFGTSSTSTPVLLVKVDLQLSRALIDDCHAI